MNVTESSSAAVNAAAELSRAMEDNERAVRQFLSSAGQVQSAYTMALGRVRQELGQLTASLRGAAAVGMNLFANLLDAAQPLADALSRLTAGLFGVTYWKAASKSAEGTASALGKVASSARSAAKAQRDLYSFDQITRVSASGGSSSGSSGSGKVGSAGGSGAGELVHISGLLEDWAVKAKQILAQIWQPFRAAWDSQGEGVLQAAQTGLREIGRAAAAVGESWLAVWTDGSGERMVSTVLQIVQRLSQTAGALASRFREAWTAGETGKRIFQELTGIVQSVLDALRDMAAATAAWAARLDFSGLVNGFANLLSAVRPLAELLSGALNWGYTNVLLPLSGWVLQAAGPAMLNLLAGAVNLLTAGLNLLKPVGTAVWEYLLKPMGNWTGTILISGLNAAARGFQTLANAINSLPAGWESLKQKASGIWTSIQNAIVGAANGCRTGTLNAFASLNQGVGSQGTSLKQKLSQVFGGVVSSVQEKLGGVKNALTTPFKNGLNGVIDLLNQVIRKINQSLKFSWDSIKIMGRTVVPAGSVTLAKLPAVSRLAQGGVTQGATLSLIGEAGREAVLPLDRNTGWMDQLADRLARAVSGGKTGDTLVEVYVGGRQMARQVIREVNDLTRETGRCPIYI
ncbi:MAG: hypothetical protein ACI3U8_07605 [Candidatus Onthomonas sp.]